jgi:putative acyl-CoA dehydrogenase
MGNASAYATHEVRNQAGDLAGYNAYTGDVALREAVRLFGGQWAETQLASCGAMIGSAHLQQLARAADRNKPELRTHDRFGNRIDGVEFHPAWHELMGKMRGSGYHSLAWTMKQPGTHVARAAVSYVWNQGENGVCCPGAMTFAAIAALRHDPALLARYEKKILSTDYDPRALPPAEKFALGVGMAMTEKQGGSDLRQTETTAVRAGAAYQLTGHKWFFSVPTSDLFLTLARTDCGISCFLVEGWRPDGSRNQLLIQRLKDKCGNRSSASAEVEFRDLDAVMLGDEGRGIATILDMGHLTRLESALGASGIVRQSLSQAIHHTRHRTAFQRVLADQPIMANVLADLAIESESLMWLTMRAAASLDGAEASAQEKLLSRILTPVAKYWVCKRTPTLVAEALECHGGNGFIEDHLMARLYREAPLNGIWEGSGNVICLDVIRALGRAPDAAAAVLDEMARAEGGHPALDALLENMRDKLARPGNLEQEARRIVEQLALGLCASLMLRHAPNQVSEVFCSTRLGNNHGMALGTLPAGTPYSALIDRASVH